MTQHDIRAASARDEPAVRLLLSEADLPAADLAVSHLPDFLVAVHDGAVGGSVGLEVCGRAGLLGSLAVSPDLRGRGIGRRLVDELESHARRRGVGELWLLTTTAADFFERLGYARTERDRAPEAIRGTECFSNLCPSSAVCMAKPL